MDEDDVGLEPTAEIERWLSAARAAGEPLPEAMTVATSSPSGRPSARMVLLRGLDERGLAFYTDRGSDKGRELADNPIAAAVLHWLLPIHRQVRVSGPVEQVNEDESDAYWASRPAGSRRSAMASHQSQVVGSRRLLEERVAELAASFPDENDLLRPERWGGFRIRPEVVELWEEGPSRLHDRFRYRHGPGGWERERLSP